MEVDPLGSLMYVHCDSVMAASKTHRPYPESISETVAPAHPSI